MSKGTNTLTQKLILLQYILKGCPLARYKSYYKQMVKNEHFEQPLSFFAPQGLVLFKNFFFYDQYCIISFLSNILRTEF